MPPSEFAPPSGYLSGADNFIGRNVPARRALPVGQPPRDGPAGVQPLLHTSVVRLRPIFQHLWALFAAVTARPIRR